MRLAAGVGEIYPQKRQPDAASRPAEREKKWNFLQILLDSFFVILPLAGTIPA